MLDEPLGNVGPVVVRCPSGPIEEELVGPKLDPVEEVPPALVNVELAGKEFEFSAADVGPFLSDEESVFELEHPARAIASNKIATIGLARSCGDMPVCLTKCLVNTNKVV